MFFCGAWMDGGWGVAAWGRNSYLGSAEIVSFASPDFSRRNKHATLWQAVSTWYSQVLFLWTNVVSDFRPFEIYKNLGHPWPAIPFSVNSHADNHFYKYIYLFQILFSIKSLLRLKYTLRFWPIFFIFKFDINVKHRSYLL